MDQTEGVVRARVREYDAEKLLADAASDSDATARKAAARLLGEDCPHLRDLPLRAILRGTALTDLSPEHVEDTLVRIVTVLETCIAFADAEGSTDAGHPTLIILDLLTELELLPSGGTERELRAATLLLWTALKEPAEQFVSPPEEAIEWMAGHLEALTARSAELTLKGITSQYRSAVDDTSPPLP